MTNTELPRFHDFDYRDPEVNALYPMPLPDGVRASILVDSDDRVEVYLDHADNHVTGWSEDVESAAADLARRLREELPGERMSRVAFDVVLYDRKPGGFGTYTLRSLRDFIEDGWPSLRNHVSVLVLAWVPGEAFDHGRDTLSLWARRSQLQRALFKMGMGNPYANPVPTIRHTTLAPETWDHPSFACAGRNGERLNRQIQNCFKRGYVGCLIVDVEQPWDVSGNQFQLITEGEYI